VPLPELMLVVVDLLWMDHDEANTMLSIQLDLLDVLLLIPTFLKCRKKVLTKVTGK
jgi:hypothetical protein